MATRIVRKVYLVVDGKGNKSFKNMDAVANENTTIEDVKLDYENGLEQVSFIRILDTGKERAERTYYIGTFYSSIKQIKGIDISDIIKDMSPRRINDNDNIFVVTKGNTFYDVLEPDVCIQPHEIQNGRYVKQSYQIR